MSEQPPAPAPAQANTEINGYQALMDNVVEQRAETLEQGYVEAAGQGLEQLHPMASDGLLDIQDEAVSTRREDIATADQEIDRINQELDNPLITKAERAALKADKQTWKALRKSDKRERQEAIDDFRQLLGAEAIRLAQAEAENFDSAGFWLGESSVTGSDLGKNRVPIGHAKVADFFAPDPVDRAKDTSKDRQPTPPHVAPVEDDSTPEPAPVVVELEPAPAPAVEPEPAPVAATEPEPTTKPEHEESPRVPQFAEIEQAIGKLYHELYTKPESADRVRGEINDWVKLAQEAGYLRGAAEQRKQFKGEDLTEREVAKALLTSIRNHVKQQIANEAWKAERALRVQGSGVVPLETEPEEDTIPLDQMPGIEYLEDLIVRDSLAEPKPKSWLGKVPGKIPFGPVQRMGRRWDQSKLWQTAGMNKKRSDKIAEELRKFANQNGYNADTAIKESKRRIERRLAEAAAAEEAANPSQPITGEDLIRAVSATPPAGPPEERNSRFGRGPVEGATPSTNGNGSNGNGSRVMPASPPPLPREQVPEEVRRAREGFEVV